jgi:hypothetical protein
MKRTSALIVAALAFGLLSSTALAAQSPLVTLTVKNHKELISSVAKVVEAAKPGTGQMIAAMVPVFLGSSEFAGVDAERPWQVALWWKGKGVQPTGAIYVPVTDLDAFKAGLDPGILLGGNGQNTLAEKNGYAIIYDGNQNGFTDVDRDTILGWEIRPSKFKNRTINIHLAPNAEVREQIVQALNMGKSAVMGGIKMGLQNTPNAGAMNPDGLTEVMEVYFELIEEVMKGVSELDVGLDVAKGDIVISENIVPVPGSALAGWFAANPIGVAEDAAAMNWDSNMTFAFSLRDDPTFFGYLEKMMAASMKMQNISAEDAATEESLQLMKELLPMTGAFSMDFGAEGLGFAGHYRFPGREGEAVRARFKKFMDDNMGKQVGEGKPYSDYKYKEGIRKIGGSSVNRMTLVYNMDSPMFSMPGQKEQIEAMFPGGKMTFDSVVVKDRMYFGTAGSLDAAVNAASRGGAVGIKAGPRTTMVGQVNVIAMMQQMLGALPQGSPLPPEVLAKLDPKGTAIRFKADQNGNLATQMRIPLKLISTFAQIGNAAGNR